MDKLKGVLKTELERAVPCHFGEVFSEDDGEQAVEKLLIDVEYIASIQREFSRELQAKHVKETLEGRLGEFETKLDEISKRVGKAKNSLSHNKSAELQELVYYRTKITKKAQAAAAFGGAATNITGSALNPCRLIDVEQFEKGPESQDVIVGVRTAMKMRHGAELGAIRSAHEQDSIQLQKKLRKAQGDLAELRRRQQEQLSTLQTRLREAASHQSKQGKTMKDPVQGGDPSQFRMDIPGSDRGICSPNGESEADDEEEKAILEKAGKQVDRATKEQKWGWNFVEQLSKNSFPSKQRRWNSCTTKARRMWNGEQFMDEHLLGADYKIQKAKSPESPRGNLTMGKAQTWHPKPDATQSTALPISSPTPLGSKTEKLTARGNLGSTAPSKLQLQSDEALNFVDTASHGSSPQHRTASHASSPTHPEELESSGLPRLPGASPPDQSSPEPMHQLPASRFASGTLQATGASRPESTSDVTALNQTDTTALPAPDGHDSGFPTGNGSAPATNDVRLAGLTAMTQRYPIGDWPKPRAREEDLDRVGSPPRSRRARRRPPGQVVDIQGLRKKVADVHGQFALPSAFDAYATPRLMKALDVA